MRRYWMVATLLLCGVCMGAAQVETKGLTVTSESEISVEPDAARIALGVTAEAPTAREAQTKVNEMMTKVMQSLGSFVRDRKDIQTTQLSLNPVYSNERPDMRGERKIVGYQASHVLTIRMTDFNRIGPAIDAAITAGANNVQSIQFLLENDAQARAEASRRAVAAARAEAEVLASAAGMQLGSVEAIVSMGAPTMMPFMAKAAMFDAQGGGMEVMPGNVRIRSSVTIRWALR